MSGKLKDQLQHGSEPGSFIVTSVPVKPPPAVAEFVTRVVQFKVIDTEPVIFDARPYKPGGPHRATIRSPEMQTEFDQRVRERRFAPIYRVRIQALSPVMVDGLRSLDRGDAAEVDPEVATRLTSGKTPWGTSAIIKAVILGNREPFTPDQLPPDPTAKTTLKDVPRVKCLVLRRGTVHGYWIDPKVGTVHEFNEDLAVKGYFVNALSPAGVTNPTQAFSRRGQIFLYELLTNNILMGKQPEYGFPKPATVNVFKKGVPDFNSLKQQRQTGS